MDFLYKNTIILHGQFLQVSDTQKIPKIKLYLNPQKIYCLIMYDPNAKYGNKIHWTIINITNNNIHSGKEIISYKSPAPSPNTGIHHYIFVLYEQTTFLKLKHFSQRFYKLKDFLTILNIHTPRLYQTCFRINNTKKKFTRRKNQAVSSRRKIAIAE